MARTRFDKYVDSAVVAGATDVDLLPVIPSGQVWYLTHFGGAAAHASLIALQKNTAEGWVTLRAVAGPGQAEEYFIDREYTGDGTLRFRVVRKNLHSSDQEVVYWFEAYKKA